MFLLHRKIPFKKTGLILTLLVMLSSPLLAQEVDDYRQAWSAINHNDRKKAREFLKKAITKPKTANDALLTLLWLDSFDSKGDKEHYFDKVFANTADPYPYLYALWFNELGLGGYSKKSKEQLKMIDKILDDPKANGSIKAALHYVRGFDLTRENQFSAAVKEWQLVGNINKWQFTGPFDNISGSGFEKNFAPIQHPEPEAKFISANNAEISWFTPSRIDNDGWIFTACHINESTAVVFAQSFVNAPEETQAVLCAGVSGNLKVWVNDKLVISESEERITELDTYKNTCKLNKGFNRILVQLGYVRINTPNFTIRLTDNNFQALKGLTFSDKAQSYTPDKGNPVLTTSIPLFAESFFEAKIKAEPNNFLNYIFLCQTYLRNKKVFEAQQIINQALLIEPESSLLHYEKIQCLIKADNRTELTQEIEQIKENDPEALISLSFRIRQALDEEKYEEAETILNRRIELYGDNEETYQTKIALAGKLNKVEEILKLLQQARAKYPANLLFESMQHNLQKDVYKDPKGALKVYESLLKERFEVKVVEELASEYMELGMNQKGLDLLEQLASVFPYDPYYVQKLAMFHFSVQNNDKALEYANKSLSLAPYSSTYWENLGAIYEKKGNKQAALDSYKKSLYYNPNRYETRRKINLLENKTDVQKAFPNTNTYELIKNTKPESHEGDHDWYYILDEKCKVVYADGRSEEFYNLAVKIVNEKGIENWKETSIGFNDNSQRLVVEKAEVVKKNGGKVPAERNENQLVFPKLEKGDAIYVKYKIEDYARGRFAKEFTDKYAFSNFVPSEQTRYCLLVANNIKFDYKLINSEIKPSIDKQNDFTLYTWENADEKAIKEETLMPPLGDFGKVLHLSSIKSWQEIANWYSDISSTQAKMDYEVKIVYNSLFKEDKKYSQAEKARIIYEYIVKNISYSSISFRQSAYVPQKSSKTLNTKLGDCKDLSTLYATLAREAGLTVNLVLIDTRNYGKMDLVLPSLEFNHCIVKVMIDNKPFYLELTDSNLPFGSLPTNVNGALSLEIPFNNPAAQVTLEVLNPVNKTKDKITRKTQIEVVKNDLFASMEAVRKGASTSNSRHNYATLSNEKQIEGIKKSLGSEFKNPVTVTQVKYENLDKLNDTLNYSYKFNVKNEVIEIGDLKTFKIPYSDIIFRADNFPDETRLLPISYWRYEDMDEYSEELTIKLKDGNQFAEIPKDLKLNFKGIHYTLTFKQISPTAIQVNRQVLINQKDIEAKDYSEFKTFIDAIIRAESKYVAFK